jgi:hypothetical protein
MNTGYSVTKIPLPPENNGGAGGDVNKDAGSDTNNDDRNDATNGGDQNGLVSEATNQPSGNNAITSQSQRQVTYFNAQKSQILSNSNHNINLN